MESTGKVPGEFLFVCLFFALILLPIDLRLFFSLASLGIHLVYFEVFFFLVLNIFGDSADVNTRKTRINSGSLDKVCSQPQSPSVCP